tara:strand:+ start:76 stop:504 length:429 start_codon:yes stop_codon:yes gene_type:complete
MQQDGSVLISRHALLAAVYKDVDHYSSDKKLSFGPKFGVRSPLFEHHTNSLVFNDPPLHTRVRKIMTAALNPRAIKLMEPGLRETISRLLADVAEKNKNTKRSISLKILPVRSQFKLLEICWASPLKSAHRCVIGPWQFLVL